MDDSGDDAAIPFGINGHIFFGRDILESDPTGIDPSLFFSHGLQITAFLYFVLTSYTRHQSIYNQYIKLQPGNPYHLHPSPGDLLPENRIVWSEFSAIGLLAGKEPKNIRGIETLTAEPKAVRLAQIELDFKRHRFPPEIIRHSGWLYARFTLSIRDLFKRNLAAAMAEWQQLDA